MWRWYAGSAFCIVYLRDVPPHLSPERRQDAIMKSEWFTRGWTLQELLAPQQQMTFFDQAWKPVGTREELSNQICRRTHIDPVYFGNLDQIKRASAATRLSWAAGRKLTRPEDIAHCLLGIMDIYMSPRYGSGQEEAFRMLQMKFTKKYRDQSIFAWKIPSKSQKEQREAGSGAALSNEHHGLFAPNPDAFAETGRFTPCKRSVWRHGWNITDQGLLSGHYYTFNAVPWVSAIKALKNDIDISVDAVDESGRVPRLRLRKINGVFYRINIDELSRDGRADLVGRSKMWGAYIIHVLPLSWKKRLDIAL